MRQTSSLTSLVVDRVFSGFQIYPTRVNKIRESFQSGSGKQVNIRVGLGVGFGFKYSFIHIIPETDQGIKGERTSRRLTPARRRPESAAAPRRNPPSVSILFLRRPPVSLLYPGHGGRRCASPTPPQSFLFSSFWILGTPPAASSPRPPHHEFN